MPLRTGAAVADGSLLVETVESGVLVVGRSLAQVTDVLGRLLEILQTCTQQDHLPVGLRRIS